MNATLFAAVVDKRPEHYFKAELLICTLLHNAGVAPHDILVSCIDGVDERFLAFLDRQGCRRRNISPFLDGAYCNKVRQLEGLPSILNAPTESLTGTLLLDVDVAFASLDLALPAGAVAGKIVDGPNPPSQVLRDVFACAGLEERFEATPADFGSDDTSTLNLNGGVLWIPGEWTAEVGREWTRWAEWLFVRRHQLLPVVEHAEHIDQISFALAMATLQCKVRPLTANENYPLHVRQVPRSLVPGRPVALLHYHSGLDEHGFVAGHPDHPAPVTSAIEQVNGALSRHCRFEFFRDYKRADSARRLGPLPPASSALTDARVELTELWESIGCPSVVFHCGTPKTATTSLQAYLHSNRDTLSEAGVLYPSNVQPGGGPKHQWIVTLLLSHKFDQLLERLSDSLAEATPHTKTVVFSTEGLFNHWWDFSNEALAELRSLGTCLRSHFALAVREPAAYFWSYYYQVLRNPPSAKRLPYGQPLLPTEMFGNEWFRRRFDWVGFISDIEFLFGAHSLQVHQYGPDIIRSIVRSFGFPAADPGGSVRQRKSMSPFGVFVLRELNRHDVPAEGRAEMLKAVEALDGRFTAIMPAHARKLVCDDDILAHLSGQVRTLAKHYSIRFDDQAAKFRPDAIHADG